MPYYCRTHSLAQQQVRAAANDAALDKQKPFVVTPEPWRDAMASASIALQT
jgi:hypothetical protein